MRIRIAVASGDHVAQRLSRNAEELASSCLTWLTRDEPAALAIENGLIAVLIAIAVGAILGVLLPFDAIL